MKKYFMVMIGVFLMSQMYADTFARLDTLNIPGWNSNNNGGIGNFVAGVDVDGDGLQEIYMVNHNWNDTPGEVIPRLYKFEQTAEGWVKVWETTPPADLVEMQNSYNPLSVLDYDGDGKQELWWGIPNNIELVLNPARVLVYEQADGDNMGVDKGGVIYPNAYWTISSTENDNVRPVSWEFGDIDSDGTLEFLMASRQGGNQITIASVSDIPDNGDGSETWTTEFMAETGDGTYTGDNKWDVAVLGANAYFFDETEISRVHWNGTAYEYSSMMPLPGGISWDAVQVADADGDGTLEMFTGEYRYGTDSRKIWLLQEDGDTLKHTALVDLNVPELLNGGRLVGGAQGDIDADGNIDFVFGSMYSGPPNAMIFRFEYQGGAIDQPANWELTVIDTAFKIMDLSSSGIWNRFAITNIDGDIGQEVLYTSMINVPLSVEYSAFNVSAPIIFLDSPNTTPSSIETDRPAVADDYRLMQNYPNPFNPITTISFSIPRNEFVTVKIFDMTGREVATLLSNDMNAGEHQIMWNGVNNSGNRVASGVYVYMLLTPSKRLTRTMTYLK